MNNEVISMREMQRNYRQLFNQAKETRQPIYLGARLRKEVVLIDAESFERLQRIADHSGQRWAEVKKTLERIRKSGKQNVSSVKLLRDDRRSH